MKKFLLLISIFLVASACSKSDKNGGTKPDGRSLEKIFLQDNGFEGNAVLIEFGRSDCEVSAEGLETIAAWNESKKFKDLNFCRVEVSGEKIESKLPVFNDPASELAAAMNATIIPTFVLVDKYGNVRFRGNLPDEAKLQKWLETMAGEEKDPGPDAEQFGVVVLNGPELLKKTKVKMLGGSDVVLDSLCNKSGLVILFTDTWCPYAEKALKEFPAVAKKLMDNDIPAVVLNITDPLARVTEYFEGKKLAAPVLYDTSHDTRYAWGISYVPMVAYITPDNKIGYLDKALWNDMGNVINTKLKFPKPLVFDLTGTGKG